MALGIGKVKGQYVTAIVDTTDPDADPDLVPLSGTITFTLNVPAVVNPNDLINPVVIGTTPYVGILDAQGYLTTPISGAAGTLRELALIANDDPDNNPTATQYLVHYELLGPGSRPVPIPDHLISLTSGATLDLAMVTPVTAAPPQQTMGIITTMTQAEFDAAFPPAYQITFITA